MGDALGGIFGAGGRQTQTTVPDEASRELNNLRRNQLLQLFTPERPYSSFASENPNNAYRRDAQAVDLTDTALADFKSGGQEADFSDLISLDDYIKLGLDQAQNYISQIASPEILSQAALSGLESGGAPQEALAKATAQIGLPFVQSIPGASIGLTQARPQANLTTAQTGAVRTSQAAQLFPLTDFGRSLRAEDVNRQQGILTSGLTGLPFSPGSSTTGRTSQQPLFNFFGQG